MARTLPKINQKRPERCLKGANKGRRGPERGPKRVQGGPEAARGSPRMAQATAHSRWVAAPSVFR